jgi:hypothetical protein
VYTHVCRPATHVDSVNSGTIAIAKLMSCKSDAAHPFLLKIPPSMRLVRQTDHAEPSPKSKLEKVRSHTGTQMQFHVVVVLVSPALANFGPLLLSQGRCTGRSCQARSVSVSRQHRCSEQSLQQDADDEDEEDDSDSIAPAMVPSGCVTCCPMITGRSTGTGATVPASPAAVILEDYVKDLCKWFSITQRRRRTRIEQHCKARHADTGRNHIQCVFKQACRTQTAGTAHARLCIQAAADLPVSVSRRLQRTCGGSAGRQRRPRDAEAHAHQQPGDAGAQHADAQDRGRSTVGGAPLQQ